MFEGGFNMAEKVKPIVLKYEDGTEYTLEFNRASVKYAERQGFSADKFEKAPMSAITELFHLAFRMHHPQLSKEQTESILVDDLGGLSEQMSERLVALYNKPYEEIANDNGGAPKNSGLTIVM